MQRKHGDGASEREHLESARRQLAKLPGIKRRKASSPIVDGPECPALLGYLWRWFCEISSGISSGGFGPAVITWGDLSAWCALTGCRLDPWEARAVIRLGNLRASVVAEKMKDKAS